MTHALRFLVGSAALALVACGPAQPGPDTTPSAATPAVPATLEELLVEVAGGTRPPGDLEVTYDDMHGLHGGETITLHGDGTVTARRRDPPDTPQTEHSGHASPEQVLEVVELLVDIRAWSQEVPERTLVPDESLAHLRLSGVGLEGGFWEFYNDLGGLDRLVRVKQALEALAFPTP
ncbi:MAG: hypothetical protein HY907_06700 [Deltaproteobacteria bacterium]|nr:hypothetical protein [Deltaproteobacteria bacterium]